MGNDETTVQSAVRVFGDVELPVALARRHENLFVGFHWTGHLHGWAAYLVGDEGDVLLGFPWYDHVDRSLGGAGRVSYAPWRRLAVDPLPTTLSEDGWDDLEQGWWGQVTPVGDDVFIAECDFDEILDMGDASGIVVARPGWLFANGVFITWNCVTRPQYAQAWQAAVTTCSQGKPSPVGHSSTVPVKNPTTGDVSDEAIRFEIDR